MKVIIQDILRDCDKTTSVEHNKDTPHCDTVLKRLPEVTPQNSTMNDYIIKEPAENTKHISPSIRTKGNETQNRPALI